MGSEKDPDTHKTQLLLACRKVDQIKRSNLLCIIKMMLFKTQNQPN